MRRIHAQEHCQHARRYSPKVAFYYQQPPERSIGLRHFAAASLTALATTALLHEGGHAPSAPTAASRASTPAVARLAAAARDNG
eukprot:1221070-Pleurochrysis_carterae.AAC.1